jgi:hypothetical protein
VLTTVKILKTVRNAEKSILNVARFHRFASVILRVSIRRRYRASRCAQRRALVKVTVTVYGAFSFTMRPPQDWQLPTKSIARLSRLIGESIYFDQLIAFSPARTGSHGSV